MRVSEIREWLRVPQNATLCYLLSTNFLQKFSLWRLALRYEWLETR